MILTYTCEVDILDQSGREQTPRSSIFYILGANSNLFFL